MDMPDSLLKIRDITRHIPISPQAIYQRCKRGTFPRPANISGGATHGFRWSLFEVNEWLQAHNLPCIPETDPTAEEVRHA